MIERDSEQKGEGLYSFSPTEIIEESIYWTNKATHIAYKNHLLEKLCLSPGEDDEAIFVLYLAQKLIKIDLYDTSLVLNHYPTYILSKLPIFSGIIKRIDRSNNLTKETLERLQRISSQNYGAENIVSPDLINKARTIELAVNELIARAAPFDQKRQTSHIKFTKELLNDWGTKWNPQLRPK